MATAGYRPASAACCAYRRKGGTYADLAGGFAIGTTTVFRYIREALDLLAAMAPTRAQAIEVARGKACDQHPGTPKIRFTLVARFCHGSGSYLTLASTRELRPLRPIAGPRAG